MVQILVKEIIYIVIFFIYIIYMGRKLNKKTLRKKNSKSRKNSRSRKNKRTFKRKYKGGGGSPSPFQGTAWSYNNLPGMSINPNGGSNANFYALNNYNRTPMQYMTSENPLIGGGKRRRSKQNRKPRKSKKNRKSRKQKKHNQKGGFVTDLINAGRYIEYEGGTFKNEINGYDRPVNPLPWADQYRTNSFSNFSSIK